MTPEQWGRFLMAVFDEWVRRDVGTVFVQMFDAALASWLGIVNSMCIFNEKCGNALALEHNGDLYSCDHFVEPKYLLGNIQKHHMLELVGPTSSAPSVTPSGARCRATAASATCGSPATANARATGSSETPDGEPGLNYLCAGYKAFFNHIDHPMRLMADLLKQGRFADEVMGQLWQEEARRFAGSARNEPCPCGSGRKFKHCHGKQE